MPISPAITWTRIHADPQLKNQAVAAPHVGRKALRLVLDGQRRKTAPKSVILQRNWRTE
jgi:hypothetical protein